MAKLGKRHKARVGEVKKRAQVFSGRNKRFTKVDTTTGRVIDQMVKKWKSFRGVKNK